jgi:hypothetical protein
MSVSEQEETNLKLSDVYVTEVLPRSVVVLYVSIIVSFTVGFSYRSLTPRQPLTTSPLTNKS